MIKIDKIKKRYGDNLVLNGINLFVKKSEVVVIIGPSGSGKSTLLRCINGLAEIDEGTIEVDGIQFSAHMKHKEREKKLKVIKRKVGFVFQKFNLFNHLTAEQNVIIALRKVQKVPEKQAKEIAHELLFKFGLQDKFKSYPSQLSGGQQQRVAIVRALALKPKVMLFDEATSALDPELIGEVLDIMEKLAREGMTMIVVTHEMQFAEHVAERVLFIDEGAVIEEGSPQEIFYHPKHKRTQSFLGRIIKEKQI
jgi:ABC-type polar amino acid transport system ATPase subunit